MSISEEIFSKASQKIPGGVNSPVRAFGGLDVAPIVIDRGSGSVIWDVDGRNYIDYCNSWGALILGHRFPSVVASVQEQLEKGFSFGIATAIEGELAEQVIRLVPSMEMVRFVSSGTEAVMSAVRLARGATGKSTIIKFEGHYHGHSDGLLVKAGSGVAVLPESSSAGVPADFVKHTLCLPFNDFATCREVLREREDIAAVILEPVTANMGVVLPEPGFLDMLREETENNGILLIFDEVVTGFRLGLGGAQGHYQIDPDLTCLGKIVGGGFPAAAFGGKRKWMQHLAPIGDVYQAGTLSGFPVAMAAGKAVLNEVQKDEFYETLQKKTDRLVQPIRRYIEENDLPVAVQSIGSMVTLFFGIRKANCYADLEGLDSQMFKKFFAHMLKKGIYLPPSQHESWFISLAHTEEQIDATSAAVIDFFEGRGAKGGQ